MINLDDPKKFRTLAGQAHQVATNMLRPLSRTYDRAEHEYPKELDLLAAMIDGLSESGAGEGAGASGVRRDDGAEEPPGSAGGGVRNGANLASVMSIAEMCWGDVGLLLSMPRQGLGNSAIASVANDDRPDASLASGPRWRSPSPAPAPTRPTSGRRRPSTAITTC
jgi:acyl-CoA dehydrogenase